MHQISADSRFERIFDPSRFTEGTIGRFISTNLRIKTIASFFVKHYFIVAEVYAAPEQRVVFSHTIDAPINDLDENMGRLQTIKRAIGQRPSSFRFNLPDAFLCESYHFRMAAPRGHYVHRQFPLAWEWSAITQDTAIRLDRDLVSDNDKRLLIVGSDKRGGAYAHFYIHGLKSTERFPLFARCIFFEPPPTAALQAAVLGVTASIPIAVVSGLLKQLVASGSIATDLPALILALPGTVALWFGRSNDEVDLVRRALLPRIGSAAIGMLSFLAALLFVVSRLEFGTASELPNWLYATWYSFVAAVVGITGLLAHRVWRSWQTYVGKYVTRFW
jgi:hypothetical protein